MCLEGGWEWPLLRATAICQPVKICSRQSRCVPLETFFLHPGLYSYPCMRVSTWISVKDLYNSLWKKWLLWAPVSPRPLCPFEWPLKLWKLSMNMFALPQQIFQVSHFSWSSEIFVEGLLGAAKPCYRKYSTCFAYSVDFRGYARSKMFLNIVINPLSLTLIVGQLGIHVIYIG